MCTIKVGWVFLDRTRILSGIKFTTHFIEILVVETKRFVGSFVHVILARQTCGQCSNKAAESKRRALGNYFPERICYMFRKSQCRRDRDLILCTTSGLAFGESQRSGDFPKKNVFRRRKNRIFNNKTSSFWDFWGNNLKHGELKVHINPDSGVETPLPTKCWIVKKNKISIKYLDFWGNNLKCFELRWGWVFLDRTRILSGIQFTTHFIENLVVETKRFVGSFLHVILARQTWGQSSSKAVESKRRALGNYIPDLLYVPKIKM